MADLLMQFLPCVVIHHFAAWLDKCVINNLEVRVYDGHSGQLQTLFCVAL